MNRPSQCKQSEIGYKLKLLSSPQIKNFEIIFQKWFKDMRKKVVEVQVDAIPVADNEKINHFWNEIFAYLRDGAGFTDRQ